MNFPIEKFILPKNIFVTFHERRKTFFEALLHQFFLARREMLRMQIRLWRRQP